MTGEQLRELIWSKRPHYLEKYKPLIEKISQKGDATQKGGYSTLGPFYQTFMYAFIIGFRRGNPSPLRGDGTHGDKTIEFTSLSNFKPFDLRDFIIATLLNESKEMGFTWENMADANDEALNAFVSQIIHRMEGYANAGLEYLQKLWNEDEVLFRDPFVFVNILEELSENS